MFALWWTRRPVYVPDCYVPPKPTNAALVALLTAPREQHDKLTPDEQRLAWHGLVMKPECVRDARTRLLLINRFGPLSEPHNDRAYRLICTGPFAPPAGKPWELSAEGRRSLARCVLDQGYFPLAKEYKEWGRRVIEANSKHWLAPGSEDALASAHFFIGLWDWVEQERNDRVPCWVTQ